MTGAMHVLRGLFLGLLLTTASCNLWPDRLGRVDLPYTEAQTRALAQKSLQSAATAEPKSVDEGLDAIRAREPIEEGEIPRAVRELDDELVPMSVAEMRALVLQNNLQLRVELLAPSIAAERVSAEIGRFDALIGSRFSYQEQRLPELDRSLSDFTSTNPALDGQVVKLTDLEQTLERLDFELGVSVPLPTGGVISLGSVLDEKSILEPQQFDQYLAATRFSFSQPLLRNAGADAALAPVRLARVDQRITRVRTKLAALRILADSEKAYWRLYAARRILEVRAEQFRLASRSLELVQRRAEQGLSPTVEINRAEVGVYQSLEKLIVAETEWRLRQRDLKRFLATERFPLRGGRMIDGTTDPLLAGLELDADSLVVQALAERPELIAIELGIIRAGIDVALRQNQVLPIANLDFQYGLLSRDDSLGSAWGSQWNSGDDELYAGISFEVPLTNQRRRAQLNAAKLTQARRLATREARELTVREEVYDVVDVIGRDWQRIVAARQNVIVSGVNYDAEQRQFEQGLRTMREVFEALTQLGEAQIREILAIVEYQAAQIDLAFATGTLLGYARVDLDPVVLPER